MGTNKCCGYCLSGTAIILTCVGVGTHGSSGSTLVPSGPVVSITWPNASLCLGVKENSSLLELLSCDANDSEEAQHWVFSAGAIAHASDAGCLEMGNLTEAVLDNVTD